MKLHILPVKMIEYLKDWRVWIVVAAIIIIIVWIWIAIESNKDTTETTDEDDVTTETDVNINKASDDNDVIVDNDDVIVDNDDVITDDNEYALALVETRVEELEISQVTADELDMVVLDESRRHKQSIGEHACLVALQRIFNTNGQVQVRNMPELRNPKTGRILELDIYFPEHKVACEYHGKQHYMYVPFFHKNGPQDLEYQRWKDTFKVNQCDKMGIFLITVPYNTPDDKIEHFIRFILEQRNIAIAHMTD